MKVTLIILFTLFIATETVAKDVNFRFSISELRSLYQEASTDSEAGKQFYELMCNYQGKDPVLIAYKAAAEAIEAKYSAGAFGKLKHLKASSKLFEKAVQLNSDDPEIRFLRYTVEFNTPRYLKMSEHLAEDKEMVINSLSSFAGTEISVAWLHTVCEVMLSLGHCTEAEKKVLKSLEI